MTEDVLPFVSHLFCFFPCPSCFTLAHFMLFQSFCPFPSPCTSLDDRCLRSIQHIPPFCVHFISSFASHNIWFVFYMLNPSLLPSPLSRSLILSMAVVRSRDGSIIVTLVIGMLHRLLRTVNTSTSPNNVNQAITDSGGGI